MPSHSTPTQEIRRSRHSLHRRCHLVRAVALFPPDLHKIQVPRHFIKRLKHQRMFRNTTRSTIIPTHFICRHLHPRYGGEQASFVPLQTPTKAPSYSQTHLRHRHRRVPLLQASSSLRFQRSNVQRNGSTINVWGLPPGRSCSPVGDR